MGIDNLPKTELTSEELTALQGRLKKTPEDVLSSAKSLLDKRDRTIVETDNYTYEIVDEDINDGTDHSLSVTGTPKNSTGMAFMVNDFGRVFIGERSVDSATPENASEVTSLLEALDTCIAAVTPQQSKAPTDVKGAVSDVSKKTSAAITGVKDIEK